MTALLESARRRSKVFGGGMLRQASRATVALDDFSLDDRRRAAVDHRDRRRERQRQDDPGAPAARPDRSRPAARCSTGARICASSRPAIAAHVPARRPGDLPGPVRGLQPVLQGRPRPRDADREVQAGAESRPRRATSSRRRCDAVGLRPEETLGRYPHQLQRRPAATHHGRAGAVDQAAADHRRRAGLDGRCLAARDDPGEPAQAEPTISASRCSTSPTT